MLLITRDMRRNAAAFRPFALWKVHLLNSFTDFGLAEPILRALAQENYITPTPIQAQTIPSALGGRDVVGIAQTGTGKTAAFALPILHRLAAKPQRPERKSCRVLVLSPTRELSGQILDSFNAYGRHIGLTSTLAIGGVPMGRQVRALMHGVDVLVATPGRLLDLVRGNALRLGRVEYLVLDEADRMLDMGFIHDIRKIVALLPTARQTLFFSATMPQQIAELAKQMLRDPVRVAVTPAATTAERVEQRVIHVARAAKPATLADLLRSEAVERALVFTRTKHGADKVVRGLAKSGIAAHAIHGNKSQNQRERVLGEFRSGKIRTLVATDIAARGIDVDGISHVVNYDLPNEPETYVHRIGRTARAGAAGIAISLVDGEEVAYLRAIERLIRLTIAADGTPAARAPQADGRAKHERRADNRPHGHRGAHGAAKGRPSGGSAKRSGQGGREHHHAQRNGHGGNGHARQAAPVYGERPRGPARQPQGPRNGSDNAAQGTQGMATVGFMRRPAHRRDDAGRPPR
jgi:ATP-dependent RNA helicase RhlE